MNDGRIQASPSAAASAYAQVQAGGGAGGIAGGDGFGAALEGALQGVVQSGHAADAAAAKAISGEGNLTQVVMAVSKAQLALQSTTVIRDRVVQAYQDIMKMSI